MDAWRYQAFHKESSTMEDLDSSHHQNVTGNLQKGTVCDGSCSSLRKRLRWYKLSPIMKFKIRRRYIVKFILQIVKIIFIMIQGIVFSKYQNENVSFTKTASNSMLTIFLNQGTDKFEDTIVYSKLDLITQLHYTKEMYNTFKNTSLHYLQIYEKLPITSCFKVISSGKTIEETCLPFEDDITLDKMINYYINSAFWPRIYSLTIKIGFKIIVDQKYSVNNDHICMNVTAKIVYDMIENYATVKPKTSFEAHRLMCNGNPIKVISTIKKHLFEFVFILIFIIVSSVSCILSFRSFISNINLFIECRKFFKINRNRSLKFNESIDFFNPWFLMYIVTDILSFISSISFLPVLFMNSYDVAFLGIIVGLNSLLIWIGVLRYFAYFDSYNFLHVMIKDSFGNLSRLILCGASVFNGIALAMYSTLGPYHYKYKTIPLTYATLFGLMVGDELYHTYEESLKSSPIIRVFTNLVSSIHIMFFLYVVESIFVAILCKMNKNTEPTEQDQPIFLVDEFINECSCELCNIQETDLPY